MKKTLLLFALFSFTYGVSQKQRATGGIIDTAVINKLYKFKETTTRGNLPSKYSLKKYAPKVMDQGDLLSCVGWATAYTGLTIVKRIESEDLDLPPFSALSIFNRIVTADYLDPCEEGSSFYDAIELLKNKGAPFQKDYDNTCHRDFSNESYQNKLYDYHYFDANVWNIKFALSRKEPLVISFKMYYLDYMSYLSDDYIDDNGLWHYTPPPNVELEASYLSHAMTIVGYDDDKFGGAFEVINSWGEDWAKEGCFWLKYKDVEYINSVFSLVPKFTDASRSAFVSSVIQFTNDCDEDAFVSIAYRDHNGYNSKGWWPVDSKQTVSINIADRVSNEIYWMAVSRSLSITWNSDFAGWGKEFCYKLFGDFYYPEEILECPKKEYYHIYKPDNRDTINYKLLSCNTVATRGSVLLEPISINYQLDPREYLAANKNWDSKYPLFDALTNDPIIVNKGSFEDTYTLWYINEALQPAEFKGSVEELKSNNHLKFKNKQNANEYLQYVIHNK